MIHHVPDLDVGRCKNLRPDPGDAYGATLMRCLRHDGHATACRFASTLPDPGDVALTAAIYVAAGGERKPWVEPASTPGANPQDHAASDSTG